MPRETRRFSVRALNRDGVEVSMTVVERNGDLALWNGLGQDKLALSTDWTWSDLEDEIKRLSGATRVVLIPA